MINTIFNREDIGKILFNIFFVNKENIDESQGLIEKCIVSDKCVVKFDEMGKYFYVTSIFFFKFSFF